ncbi:uncharacterized protein LOC141860323 isoform X2 [Acropora palmata]|uniref:uncharacterized protein LOC141860323 isoform X2 n=1 Tax=Acropora palmata TaxID=6131 RepID=UPI003DA0E2C0
MATSTSICLGFLPPSLRKSLLGFQKEGVRFGISKQGRCLIADEMGLGKTLQAISIAYYFKSAWPLLIVVPSSVKFSWIDEIEKWLPEVEPHDINLIQSGSDISNLGRAVIHVIGYGLLSAATSRLLIEALTSHKFNIVILDESHYLKERKATRTKRLHQLCKKAKHAILLSGTPSLARPRELYTQLDIVCPGKFGSFSSFVKRYCDAHSVYYRGERHFDTSGASNLDELYNLLKRHVMIRRLKKEVLTQLPPKRRQKVVFDILDSSSKDRKELQQVMEKFKKCAALLRGDGEDLSLQSPLFEMNKLSVLVYKYTGIVKVGPVLKYIEDLAQGMDGKFIVFFRHCVVRQAIVEKLVKLKLKHICIAGDVPSAVRGDLVHSFQTDPEVRIAALSIEAASFGLTLTAAHHVVFAELHHTPGVIIQAEDRAHRIGQTLPVNVHYLIARGTVDEILWRMIRRKIYVTSSTLDGVCKELTVEDGDENQARQLSACAAWVQDQEEDADELEEFVMSELSLRTSNQDASQRDLRSFFSPVSHTRSILSTCASKKEECVKTDPTHHVELVSVIDSDDDDDNGLSSVRNDADNHYSDRSPVEVSMEITDENNSEHTPLATFKEYVHLITESKGNGQALSTTEATLSERNPETRNHDTNSGNDISTGNCPLKPKTIKFKKEKDGKLTFATNRGYSKLQKRENQFKSSAPTITENDPDSESQTFRSYLNDDCEAFKAENTDGMDAESVQNASDGDEQEARPSRDGKADDFSGNTSIFDVGAAKRRTPQQMQIPPNPSCAVHGDYAADSSITRMESHSLCGALEKSDFEGLQPKSNETERHFIAMETLVPEGKQDIGNSEKGSRSKRCSSCHVGDYCDVEMNISKEKGPDFRCSFLKENEAKDVQPLENMDKSASFSAQSATCVHSSGNFAPCSTSDVRIRGDTLCRHESSDELSSHDFVDSSLGKYQTEVKMKQNPIKTKKRRSKRRLNNTSGTCKKGASLKCKEPPRWSCIACTFINDGLLMECSICFTPRGNATENKNNTGYMSRLDVADVLNAGKEIKQLPFGDSRQFESNSSERTQDTPEKVSGNGLSEGGTPDQQSHKLYKASTEIESVLPPWHCSFCTFINMAEMIECSICLTPRRRSQRLSDKKSLPSDHKKMDMSRRKRRWDRDILTKDRNDESDFVVQSSLKRVHDVNCDERDKSEQVEGLCEGFVSQQVVPPCLEFNRDLLAGKESTLWEERPLRRSSQVMLERNDTFLESERVEIDVTQQNKNTSNYNERLIGDDNVQSKQMEELYDHPKSDLKRTIHDDFSFSIDTFGTTSSSRKRLKLHDYNEISTLEGSCNISDFSDDSEIPCRDDPCTVASSVTLPAVLTSDFSSDGKLQMYGRTRISCKSEKIQYGKGSEQCDPLDYSDKLANTTKGRITGLGKRLENTVVGDPAQCLSGINESKSKGKENVEELYAVVEELNAEEILMSDWENDDEHWWEEINSSEQSSYPSSGDAASSGHSIPDPNKGFAKCSDLYSINELKPKLYSSGEETKAASLSADFPGLGPDHQTGQTQHQENCAEDKDDEDTNEPDEIPVPMKLKFCLSFYTERVYLYNEDDEPLGMNFCMSDVINENTEDLPTPLHHDHNLKQVKRFLNCWKRMGEGKKRVLRKSALVFDDPLEAYEQARRGITRESSYVRHPSKEAQIKKVVETAGEIGGTVRVFKKPAITKRRAGQALSTNITQASASSEQNTTQAKTCYQAVGADGIPLCLFCSSPVEFAARLRCSDWEKRFCSYDCKKEYQVRVSGTAARRALFEAEKGVCQICSMDAHSLYLSVMALNVRDRPAYLAQTPFASLPQQTLKKMVMEPKEGVFWEADHITPVSEGGGECGLENYRTLCIMCHRKVTEELNRRLKQRKAVQNAAGCGDISVFFRPLQRLRSYLSAKQLNDYASL